MLMLRVPHGSLLAQYLGFDVGEILTQVKLKSKSPSWAKD
jgi:hypothetical protein